MSPCCPRSLEMGIQVRAAYSLSQESQKLQFTHFSMYTPSPGRFSTATTFTGVRVPLSRVFPSGLSSAW